MLRALRDEPKFSHCSSRISSREPFGSKNDLVGSALQLQREAIGARLARLANFAEGEQAIVN